MKNNFSLKYFLILFLNITTNGSFSQANITVSGSYSQNFNTLLTSGSATWTDNSTIPNWYSQRAGTGTTIVASDGSSSTGNLYSFGNGTSTDRALGAVSSATPSNMAHGVLFRNTSGTTLNALQVSYTLEQWRSSGAAAQSITFCYQKNAVAISNLDPNIIAGAWTQVGALSLASPITGGSALTLDGNAVANRVVTTFNITGLALANNEYIMLKWDDPDHSGFDHGLAIDDVTISWTISCVATHGIHDVQGSGNTSPLTSSTVGIRGIVTGVKSNGFFMQEPDATADANPNTSEGIFVFTSSTPPAAVVIGNDVCVIGTVSEFTPASDPNSPSITEITAPSVTLNSTGNPLPAAIVLTTADLGINSIYNLEKYEGMRVRVNSLTVTGPTIGIVNEPNATATSSGYFYGVVTGTARPFRETGVQQPDPLPGGAPASIPRWDANPEIIGVDTKVLSGGTLLDVSINAVVTNVTGPLDYVNRYYTIDEEPFTSPVVTNNTLPFTSVPAAASTEVSVGSLNMRRFFDATDDPSISEPILTVTAFNNRLNKASLTIRNVLNFPDVLGVEEVENLTTLQSIANKVNNDAVANAQLNPNYQAYLVEGNDIGGIDVGLLVKSPKISVVDVTQFGKTATYINPNSGNPETLYDRPPLLLRATFSKPGCATPISFTVIVNHLRSLASIDDATNGNMVRTKRRAQAEYLANLIQARQAADPNEKIISIGDYNSYQFNDGYVDGIGTIKGVPTPASEVVLASSDLVNPDLTNLNDTYSAALRYSYCFKGSAHAIDHILVTQNIVAQVSNYGIARIGSDFPEVYSGDASRPERLTDHDAPVAYFNFTCPPSSLITDYFRSRQTGNWNDVNTWESSPVSDFSSGVVTPATLTPNGNSNTVTIRAHVVTVTANVISAKINMNSGGQVVVNTGVSFTVK